MNGSFKLGDIVTVKQGFTFKEKHQGTKGGRWNYYKVADIGLASNGKYLIDAINTISDETLREIKATPFQKGSIVFPRVGAALRNNNKKILFEDSLTDDNVIVLTIINSAITDNEYLYYWFENVDLARFCNDGLVPVINGSNLKKQPVILPPLPEQKAIADLLSTWDSAIEKTERLIAAKEKRFQWLLDELISKPSRAGKWREVNLSSICKIKKGSQLNVADMIEDGKFYALNGGITPSGRINDWNTPENTITISEGGNSCGFVSFNTEKFWAGGHLYSLVDIKSQKVYQKYLYHFLKNIEPRIMKLRVGSGLPNIQKKDVDNIKVMLPKIEVQSDIALVLDDGRKEIDILKSLADKYKEQKRGLMQKLLTGEWRVKVQNEGVTV